MYMMLQQTFLQVHHNDDTKKLTFDDSNLDRIWGKFEMQTFPKRFVPHKNFGSK